MSARAKEIGGYVMVLRMAPGTGLPASTAELMMDAGEVTEKGVVAPDGCIVPHKFLAAFLKRGARIHQTEKISSMFEVQQHRSLSMKEAKQLNISRSRELYEEASGLVPGGVLGARKPTDFIVGEYPISFVTGKRDVMMAAADKPFISSTFFPNSEGFVAALKTIEILERDNVLANIWEKGERFMKKIQAAIDKHTVGAELTGVAPMFYITFEKDKTGAYKGRRKSFYTQLIRKGFFFTPYHHAYISFRHTEEDLDLTLNAIDESLSSLKQE